MWKEITRKCKFILECSRFEVRTYHHHLPQVLMVGDYMYEHVELKPITRQEKEIDVAPNAVYGTVCR